TDTGPCQRGTERCANGQWQSCQGEIAPVAEQCNGVDDDCDGAADEGDPGAGFGCDASGGQGGECVAGTTFCAGGRIGCAPGEPGAELCNALDDDCDGATDEAVPEGDLCGTGRLGVCAVGLTECRAGAPLCLSRRDPSAERCNGLDDDCDGSIDEGAAEVGSGCATGLLGACAMGTRQCVGGALVCRGLIAPVPETCNGSDDDCDGLADERQPGAGLGCDPGGPDDGACRTGTTACADGALVCVPGEPGAERCDGRDDDCDGRIDEQIPEGGACQTGEPGVCAAGGLACRAGGFVCLPRVAASAEACNGLDDDCDGNTDEGALAGVPCQTGSPGACAAGTLRCVAGAPVCTPRVVPMLETCNGADDDCDGATDESNPGAGFACNAGQPGQCAAGSTACVGGVTVCQPGAPGAETCNGV
ncbi:MAG: hypothetical protein KC620_26045, partial [Myxococcales bacterium]|nr:hypothetical protein [Myxococcales bacterium]